MDMEKGMADKPYPDMGKEDLLRFSETPFWRGARIISILLFWAAWLALLGAVIGLTIVAPRCGDPPEPQWWQKTVIYQIYIRSFYDSDNDGIGDLNGITAKLDYLKELGVGAILVSSFYKADDAAGSDYGYQVLDHLDILPTYGTMSDFENLVSETHSRGMAIIVDFIPNYTSVNHTWFIKSSSDHLFTNEFWNYYVWADSSVGLPTNWLAVYGSSAWTVVGTKYYLHQFLESEPDLNLRSTAVRNELEKILRFWLDKDVDGFRVVASAYLIENQDLRDESPLCSDKRSTEHICMDHIYTMSQPETNELIADWRYIVDSYGDSGKGPGRRILLTDADVGVDKAMGFYGPYGRGHGANLPINYQLTKTNSTCDSGCIGRLVYEWLDSKPTHTTADWFTGDQDRSRQMSQVDGQEMFVNIFNMLKMTLPGTAFIYYGEEIGMTNGTNAGIDPAGIGLKNAIFSRDGCRTPMQWTKDANAGFTNHSSTWIPVPSAEQLNPYNVEDQKTKKDGIMAQLKSLIKLRAEEKSLQFGRLHKSSQDSVFSFVREHEGFNRILVVGSFGNDTGSTVDLTKYSPDISIPTSATVVFVTSLDMKQKVGKSADLKSVSLSPGQGFIAKWAYARP